MQFHMWSIYILLYTKIIQHEDSILVMWCENIVFLLLMLSRSFCDYIGNRFHLFTQSPNFVQIFQNTNSTLKFDCEIYGNDSSKF
jgi:hypothetical protein